MKNKKKDTWCAGWVAGWNAQAEIKERTCKNVMEPGYNYFECSECGEKKYSCDTRFNYCPNCGAKVIDDD